MSTNWLVSTGSVGSYPASMVNFIWFTDERCSSCQHLATWRHKIRCLAIQKLIHLISGVCWCTVLLKGVKVKLSPQVRESDRFGHFVAAMLKLQQFAIKKPDKVRHRRRAAIHHVCQHRLQQSVCTRSTLRRQHTSRLAKIFNNQPYFV